MEIKLAKTAGFCFGVNRAVDRLYEIVKSGEKVCTLGPIIHNPQVIEDLKSKGVVIADSIDDIPKDIKLVLRTHGVEKSVIDKLKEKGYGIRMKKYLSIQVKPNRKPIRTYRLGDGYFLEHLA